MKKDIFLLLGSLFFMACSSQEPQVINIKQSTEETVANNENVIANTVADVEISGMVCEHNCVSSVKKKLTAMLGVTETTIDFDADSDINHAIIKYDNKLTSQEKIVDAIESLNDNSYKVHSFEIKLIEGNTNSSSEVKTEGKTLESATTIQSPSLIMPNIFDLFQGLL